MADQDNGPDHPITPFGCRHCSAARSEHSQPRQGPMDCHGWEEPTDRQILARMRARRTQRL